MTNYYRPVPVRMTGRAVTRNKRSASWHTFHILMTLCTGGLWGFVYFAKFVKGRSRHTVTTYR